MRHEPPDGRNREPQRRVRLDPAGMKVEIEQPHTHGRGEGPRRDEARPAGPQ